MIQNTIAEIEDRIRRTGTVDETRKSELLALLAELKNEIDALSHTHTEEARSIAGLTKISANEATRTGNNPQQVQSSLEELSASVTGFESSHPALVQIVNRICTTLANLGI